MDIVLYPEYTSSGTRQGPVHRFLRELQRKDPSLWSLTKRTLAGMETMDTLHRLEEQGIVERLRGMSVPLYEIRIPKRRRGGVVRLYFGYAIGVRPTIVLLAGEVKRNMRSKPHPAVISHAIQRYMEVCL